RASILHADAAVAIARSAGQGTAGLVRIGFHSAALYRHLPERLARLRHQLPEVAVKLFELSTNEQLAALMDGTIDIGFAHPPFGPCERIDGKEFAAEGTIAVLPDAVLPDATPPNGSTSTQVTLAEIAALGLILFPAAQGPVLHARIMDSFANAGI